MKRWWILGILLFLVVLISGSPLWAPDYLPAEPVLGPDGETFTPIFCGSGLRVFNRTEAERTFVYVLGLEAPRKYTVKAHEDVDVGPLYCPSYLVISTDKEKVSSVLIKLGEANWYDLVWSPDKEKYIFKLYQPRQ
jgi:hypothetical protein